CFIVAGLLCAVSVAVAAPAKNIVMFVADDLSPDAGCYGNRVIKTPNLDRLAAEGTLFRHAFCTTASCSPSRSVILYGVHNQAQPVRQQARWPSRRRGTALRSPRCDRAAVPARHTSHSGRAGPVLPVGLARGPGPGSAREAAPRNQPVRQDIDRLSFRPRHRL